MPHDAFNRRAFNRTLLGVLAAPVAACGRSSASDAPHSAVYLLDGSERQDRILAGARQEGIVAIYTSLNTQDSVPLTTAFEKKHGATSTGLARW